MVKIYSTFYKLFHLIDFLGIWFKFMNVRFGTGVGGHQSLMILFYEWGTPRPRGAKRHPRSSS